MPETDEGQVKKEQEEEEGEQSKNVSLFVRRNPIDPRTIMTPDPLFAAMPGQRSGYIQYSTFGIKSDPAYESIDPDHLSVAEISVISFWHATTSCLIALACIPKRILCHDPPSPLIFMATEPLRGHGKNGD